MDRGAVATRRVTVAIVDDHPVVWDGVRAWIAADAGDDIEVVATEDSVDALLDGPGRSADVVLLDLNLHGQLALGEVSRLADSGRRVVVYSMYGDDATVLEALHRGAFTYLSKTEGREHCVATIRAAADDRPYVPPAVAGAMAADSRTDRPRLSDQERTALVLWFQSMSKASVAQRMGLKESTVRQYINRARIKYANVGRPAPTQTALLARAIEDGLVRADEVHDYRSLAADPGDGYTSRRPPP